MSAVVELAGIVESARQELRRGAHPEPALTGLIERCVGRHAPLLDPVQRAALCRRVRAELTGLGPLEPWLADPAVTEVMVNAGGEVWIDRTGRTERVDQLPEGRLAALVERIIAPLGLRLDRTRPIVDARLADGSRLCAVAPPLAPDGLCCSIRRFRRDRLGLDAFADPPVAAVLRELVTARSNVVVSGATSAGKTTLLNALASWVAPGERLLTIEDTAELSLGAEHVLRLESRPADPDGTPAVGIRELVRTALRLRPDRLVVGEVRGPEALDMVQALNTGHDGSLTTCHANSALDAVRRIEAMVLMGAPNWPLAAVREQVHGSIDCIVHVARGADGRRRVTEIAELARPGGLDGPEGRLHTVITAGAAGPAGPLRRRRDR